MKIEVKYKLTEELFKEDLEQWIKFVSKGRSSVVFYASSMIFLGVFLLINGTDPIIATAVSAFGVYQIIKHIRVKKNWLADRRNSTLFNKEVVLEFTKEDFKQINVPEEMLVEEEISKYVETAKGLFIYFGEKKRLYIPNYSFSKNEDKKQVIKWLIEWLKLSQLFKQ